MIIYDDKLQQSLADFGIEIPLSRDRAKKAFEYLKDHPEIGRFIDKWFVPRKDLLISKKDLLRVHSKEYVDKLYSDKLDEVLIETYELIDENGEYHRYKPENAKRPLGDIFGNILNKVSGSYQCAAQALKSGFCFFFGGGMHHAQLNYGKGFCVINDVVITCKKLQAENNVKTIWIIDVDAHKGDGTAALTRGDESIITLSAHMATGWPLNEKEYGSNGALNPSFTPSKIDIPVKSGEEGQYLGRLEEGLKKLEDEYKKPDIAIVVLGSDPYQKDELESAKELQLTLSQMKERDLLIYNFLKTLNIPQAHLMAGGYGKSSWEVYAQFLEYVLMDRLF